MEGAKPGRTISHPVTSTFQHPRLKKGKIVSAEEAVRLIRDGDTVATSGFVGAGFAEEIALKLEEYFLANGRPRNLTLVYAAGQGDGVEKGLNHMGHEGLVRRVIGGHIGLAPKLQKLIRENKILAYNFPQGVISHLFRDIAAHRVGTITKVGMGTYIDPRFDGGKLNELTKKEGEDLIKLVQIEGEDYLLYKAFPINVAIIRGTTADINGNITMEKEALTQEALAIAMAAKNSKGLVIAQVERVAEYGTLNARNVKIPGIMVDCVVISRPENHWQTFATQYNPAFSCEIRVPSEFIPPMEMNERKIICRRAAFEIKPNMVVNLGIGMPEGVAQVANEEKILDLITLTAEPGVIGGIPAGGLNFGAGTNMDALIDQPYQFDFYDGGGLDIAFLGLAQADQYGNLNVSKFGPRFTGPGGFINISQRTKKIVFVGTFTAGKLKVDVKNGKLKIIQEGKEKKFLKNVEQITFSGKYALETGQTVLYITERCVFQLTPQGMELIEIAPGIDLHRDILGQMEFQPIINNPRLMDGCIFRPELMNLKDGLLSLPLEERLIYNPAENLFFVNFEGLYIKDREEIQKIKSLVEQILGPLGKKVYTIVNYDNFNIIPELVDDYTDMVKELVGKYYERVTRYTTSTFLRMKLGESLEKRQVSPHIYESREEAREALKKEA
ncbi:MAG: acyl CoA:acetate/3-ketoacid CoA transferase [Thermodesulfobacteriota bacterium]